MAEWRLFEGETPHVSTFEYHRDRARAPHLEQDPHRWRLLLASDMVWNAARLLGGATVSDLGCGDGGLLSLVQDLAEVTEAWGYDFTPANAQGWRERGVSAMLINFVEELRVVKLGDIVVLTEVLEHLADPHGLLDRIVRTELASYVVASSPRLERAEAHDASHAWAWDEDGYAALFADRGYDVIRHERVDQFQALLARVPA